MEFIKSSILYYLFFLTIPIIIHLFNFRKHKKIYFSSLFFLKEIEKKNKSTYQIRRWVILFNRILAIICIIIAFALPYIKNQQQPYNAEKIGIYIDNSFSMERIDNQKINLIDNSKKNAKKIISTLNPEQKILILTNDFEKKHQKWYTPQKALKLIEEIKLSGNEQKLKTIIERYHNNIDTFFINSLYLLSDFQKKTATNFLQKIQNLHFKIGLLKAQNNNNIGIDSCYFNTPIRKNNALEVLSVKLSNYSLEKKKITSSLMINNQQKESHSITIPPEKSIIQQFHYVNPINSDTINGVIEIEDNLMKFDNKLYFSYSTNQKIQVLSIGNDPQSKYLKHVFSDTLFDFHENSIDQVQNKVFNRYNLIIIDEIAYISELLMRKLELFVNQGGNLFVFVSEYANIDSYNMLFKNLNIDFINTWKTKKQNIEYINYQNSVFNNVFIQINKNINLPSVTSCFSIIENNKSQRRKIFNFINNEPFLTEYICNKGKVYVCLSDLNAKNNSFPEHALFIPCLYNASLNISQKEKLYHLINEEMILSTNDINKNDIVQLKKTRQFDMVTSLIERNKQTFIKFQNNIPLSGNYELVVNNQRTTPISFNYNRLESKMNFLSKEDIANTLGNYNIDFLDLKNNTLLDDYTENDSKYPLETFFIISSILLLIIELILLRIWKI